jgi:hypothetical protein
VHKGNGGVFSSTCSTACSQIRNTVATNADAQAKYNRLHGFDVIMDKFILGKPL